jgi:hypothetical protein
MLSRPGSREIHPVHILVLTAFAGPCPPGQEAWHGPDGKLDAGIANLCWGTRVQNFADRVRDGQDNRGERHYAHKLTAEQVLEIRRLCAAGQSRNTIAAQFGISFQHVSAIALRKAWCWL